MMAGTTVSSRGQAPIDRGWSWMVCLGFFIFVFFMVGLAKSFGLILVALINEFGVTTATASLPMSVTLFVYAFGAPTAIMVAERFTIQKVVVLGAVIGFAGIALSSLLLNMVYFILTFGLFYGIGNSCFYGNGMIMIGKYFKERRSLANGLALSGASIGQFALPPIIEYCLENYGLNGTLLLVGSFYLHGAISGLLFRPIEQYDDVVGGVVVKNEIDERKTDYQNGGDSLEEKKLLSNDENNEITKMMMANAERGGGGEDGYYTDKNKHTELSKKEIINVDNDDDGDDWEKEKKLMLGSQGSIFMVSKSTPDLMNSDSGYHKYNGSEKDKVLGNDEKKKKGCKDYLARVVDFSLLRNYVTIFFTIVSFLCFFGYFNFILFLPSIVLEKGIEKYDKAMLISICGIGDLIARINVGFFGDLNIIPRYKIKALACLFCAVNIFMFVFADSFAWLAVHCFLYGFLGGAYVCMIAVVLVDFVGLANMGRNLAVVLFIQGIGSSAGNPLLGFLKDTTGSFVIVSVMCSLSLGIGAVILFFYPVVQRLEAKRVERVS